MKNIQELLYYLRAALSHTYEKPEAEAMAMQVAEHVLQRTRLQLSTERQRLVPAPAWQEAEKIIMRLQQHEPLQYVLESAHFYGLELAVSPAVLIPRPETEELVDLIVKENTHKASLTVLDVCTGSGCIALALAAHLRVQTVYGIDISGPALAVAQRNAFKYNQSVVWRQHDILAGRPDLPAHAFDIIVSNPPYVMLQEKVQMRPNVLAYEPHLALFVPDEDALRFYRQIATQALTLLKPTGILYFEINENKAVALGALLQELGYIAVTVLPDLFGKDRFIRAGLNSI